MLKGKFGILVHANSKFGFLQLSNLLHRQLSLSPSFCFPTDLPEVVFVVVVVFALDQRERDWIRGTG